MRVGAGGRSGRESRPCEEFTRGRRRFWSSSRSRWAAANPPKAGSPHTGRLWTHPGVSRGVVGGGQGGQGRPQARSALSLPLRGPTLLLPRWHSLKSPAHLDDRLRHQAVERRVRRIRKRAQGVLEDAVGRNAGGRGYGGQEAAIAPVVDPSAVLVAEHGGRRGRRGAPFLRGRHRPERVGRDGRDDRAGRREGVSGVVGELGQRSSRGRRRAGGRSGRRRAPGGGRAASARPPGGGLDAGGGGDRGGQGAAAGHGCVG